MWTCETTGSTTECVIENFDGFLLPFMWFNFLVVFVLFVVLFISRIKYGNK